MAIGRVEEALAQGSQTQQIDPLALRLGLATDYYWARRYDEAIAEARRALATDPTHWSGHLNLGLALEQKRDFQEALIELRKAAETSNNKVWLCFVAHDLALAGNKAGAEEILNDLQRLSKRTYVSPWVFAIIYPDLGYKEKAFFWLERCYRGREHDLVFSKVWPMFDSLRSDSRYQDLMRRIGLPD
jgi:tetratricopeptide (TPR) repeat protein